MGVAGRSEKVRSPVRILVCGAGSIGRRHIANLQASGAAVHCWRERGDLADVLAAETGAVVHRELGAGLAAVDAVVVATATDRHLPVAMAAVRAGRHLFLEKPVAHVRDGVAELDAACRTAGLVVEIGCPFRAHPTLRALSDRLAAGMDGPVYTFRAVAGQRLDTWRPGTDWRAGFGADAARGGGALLELVHEIDLVHWLVGPVRAVSADLASVSDLRLAADDLANLVLSTAPGAVGQVQLDMLSPAPRRSLEIVCRDAVYCWALADGRLERADASGRATVAAPPEDYVRNDMYRDHMQHFLARIADPALPPLCSLADGIAVLDVALAARRAALDGHRVALPADSGGAR